ncbi:MAG: DUF705 domain-containing protein [Spirochaetales bacterium]|nr:DUF705 domain-containing protein [Spirochaetales bacterium]
MIIAFDMDNTLIDEFGSTVRPGIIQLLDKLKGEHHTLVLWTNSARARARMILRDLDLEKYFDRFIFRENYDPDNKNRPKDLRKIDGDILIDDDPGEIRYVKSIKRKGILIHPFRKGKSVPKGEIKEIYRKIHS